MDTQVVEHSVTIEVREYSKSKWQYQYMKAADCTITFHLSEPLPAGHEATFYVTHYWSKGKILKQSFTDSTTIKWQIVGTILDEPEITTSYLEVDGRQYPIAPFQTGSYTVTYKTVEASVKEVWFKTPGASFYPVSTVIWNDGLCDSIVFFKTFITVTNIVRHAEWNGTIDGSIVHMHRDEQTITVELDSPLPKGLKLKVKGEKVEVIINGGEKSGDESYTDKTIFEDTHTWNYGAWISLDTEVFISVDDVGVSEKDRKWMPIEINGIEKEEPTKTIPGSVPPLKILKGKSFNIDDKPLIINNINFIATVAAN